MNNLFTCWKRKHVCSLLLLCLFLFPCFVLTAQIDQYSIVHYTTDQGLPQNSITGINFDKWGYCWLGTEMGLVRFDGKTSKVFNSDNIQGLQSNRFRFSTIDTLGNVYFRTEKNEQLIIDINASGMSPTPRLEKNSNMWLPTMGGLAMFSPAMSNWAAKTNKTSDQGTGSIPPSFNIGSGGVYSVENNNLFYRSGNRFIPVDTLQNVASLNYLKADDYFLIKSKGSPLRVYKHGIRQKQITAIQGPVCSNKAYLKGDYHYCISYNQGYIYAGNTLYGTYVADGQIYSKVLLENIDIPALCIIYYHAAQQKYYFGSLVSGLYIVSGTNFHYPNHPRNAIDEGFYGQAITNNGDVICQRYRYGRNGSYQKLPLNSYVGASMFLSKSQHLYYGNEPALFRFSIANNNNQKLMDLDSRPASIFQDKTDSNTIILSTTFSIGKLAGDSLQVMKRLPGDQLINSTFQTGSDSFVIATQKGVKWYSLATNTIYRSVLDSLYIRSVYTESGGRTWISTYGKGYYLFDNNKVYTLPVHPFEALKTIHAFIEDGRGYFWLPTNNGLFKVKKDALLAYAKGSINEVYFYVYSGNANLRSNEFNGGCIPAYVWTRDSMLSLPSIAGPVQFYPHHIPAILPKEDIFIEEIILNNATVPFPAKEITIPKPDNSKLILTVSSPYFDNQENLQLVYRLEGLDNDWQPVPQNGEIILNRLPSGSYNLTVRKLTGLGINNYDSLVLPVSVNPWFYRTRWFYTVLVIASCGLLLLTVRIRTRILKERNRNLQHIIRLQTADLTNAIEQLEQSGQALKESNQMKDKVTAMILHDLRSPIRFLYTISSQLVKNFEKMPTADIAHKLSVLKSSTGSLNDFTEQFFAWAMSQHSNFKIFQERFALQTLFDELEALYTDITAINNNNLVIISTSLEIHTDKNILSVIIRNLLDNANKNTRTGTITLEARVQHHQVIVTVSDTGSGFTPELLNEFYNSNKSIGNNKNGSLIVINLLEKIGGKLDIQTIENIGTTFSIELNHHL